MAKIELEFHYLLSWCSIYFLHQLIKLSVCGELDATIASKIFHIIIMVGTCLFVCFFLTCFLVIGALIMVDWSIGSLLFFRNSSYENFLYGNVMQ